MAGSTRRHKLRLSIFFKAIAFPFRNSLTLMKLGFFPALIAIAIGYAAEAAYPMDAVSQLSPGSMRNLTVSAISNIALTIAGIIFAVGIHRLIIAGEPARWTIVRFGSAEFAYSLVVLFFFILCVVEYFSLAFALWAFDGLPEAALSSGWLTPEDPSFLGYLTVLLFAASQFTPEVRVAIWVGIFLVTIWIWARLALMFPHAAITGQMSGGVSWTSMRGNFWRLVIICMVLALIVATIYLLILTPLFVGWFGSFTPTSPPSEPDLTFSDWGILIGITQTFLDAIALAMFVALFSYAYKNLVIGENEASGADPVRDRRVMAMGGDVGH